jgi:hypothetical protein
MKEIIIIFRVGAGPNFGQRRRIFRSPVSHELLFIKTVTVIITLICAGTASWHASIVGERSPTVVSDSLAMTQCIRC